MSSPQDPITIQKEIVSNSSRPFSGGYPAEQEHNSVVKGGTLTFNTPSLSSVAAADPLTGARRTLQKEADQARVPGTPSQDELFSQATGKPLQK
ncbi:hypothetical protein HYU45_03755 [Candidatus Daviesbacteria bacterium]|nr:hypothetical protein [Candidatus Daviesbacteria bacterium]